MARRAKQIMVDVEVDAIENQILDQSSSICGESDDDESDNIRVQIVRDEKCGDFDFIMYDHKGNRISGINRYKVAMRNLNKINNAFITWCKENGYKPIINKLTPWAREAVEDENYAYLENTSPEYIFKIVLEYHDIDDYDHVLGALQSLGMLRES